MVHWADEMESERTYKRTPYEVSFNVHMESKSTIKLQEKTKQIQGSHLDTALDI